MLGIQDFGLFVIACLLLNVTPGPDTAYIVARSIQIGRRGGVAAALGIACGCLVHITAASIGLSALLLASSAAFTAIKLIGAVYLCFIGVRMLLARTAAASAPQDVADPARGDALSLRRIFWQGAMTNILNPKVALFFLAFLPQFVAAEAPSKALAFATLGITFAISGTLWSLGVAMVAARAGRRLRDSRVGSWINRVLGGFFVCLGLRLAMMPSR